ncbi:hypothetical protein GQ457_09G002800 [Hibiscus cannabinus]
MTRQRSSSWNHFGVRGPDGMLEALPLHGWMYRPDYHYLYLPTDGKQLFTVEWHTVNLKSGEISETLSTMPPEARIAGTPVACSSRIYVLGGYCRGDLFCPDKRFKTSHFHNCVFYFDSARPDCGWKKGPPMLVPRESPSAVAAGGKIYVFGSTRFVDVKAHFAEVFNVELNRWEKLPPPPADSALVPRSVSDHVLLDSSRSRILVHFESNNSLHAFHTDSGSWECLDPEFGMWSTASVIVGDFAYFVFDLGEDWSGKCITSFRAYHLVDKKWFPVKWLSDPELMDPFLHLLHLGNGRMCFYAGMIGFGALNQDSPLTQALISIMPPS